MSNFIRPDGLVRAPRELLTNEQSGLSALEIYGYSEGGVYLPLSPAQAITCQNELSRTALLEPLEGIAEMFESGAIGKFEPSEPYERKGRHHYPSLTRIYLPHDLTSLYIKRKAKRSGL